MNPLSASALCAKWLPQAVHDHIIKIPFTRHFAVLFSNKFALPCNLLLPVEVIKRAKSEKRKVLGQRKY